MPVAATTVSKRAALEASIRALGRTLVAYSGGVDSAFLAWSAYQVLGTDMLAVIADSPSLARTHLAEAVAFAREQQFRSKSSTPANSTGLSTYATTVPDVSIARTSSLP